MVVSFCVFCFAHRARVIMLHGEMQQCAATAESAASERERESERAQRITEDTCMCGRFVYSHTLLDSGVRVYV